MKLYYNNIYIFDIVDILGIIIDYLLIYFNLNFDLYYFDYQIYNCYYIIGIVLFFTKE